MESKNINNHLLHKKIGDLIQIHFPNCIKSPECGGDHKIPLYCSDENRRGTHYCDVDLLIPEDKRIKVIIEIEEADITPIRVFGKILASALSSNYILDNITYEMDDSVTFIQVLDTSQLKPKSVKRNQFDNIKESIQSVIPKCSKIKNYEICCGEQKEIIACIKKALRIDE